MNLEPLLFLFIGAFALAALLTFLVRQYALARSILDHPNERSLHELPTPRGGGLAIAATFLVGTVLLAFADAVPAHVAVAIVGGGALITLVGWLDDRQGVSAMIRIAAHAAAAIWALAWLGGLASVHIGSHVLNLGAVGNILIVIGIIWAVNLYNFMDGIDGLAGSQAVTVAGAAALIILTLTASSIVVLPVLLAAAAAGFLIFNWSPARIFMGDAGSGFLGFTFAVLSIVTEQLAVLPVAYWVLLSGVFVFDSTMTLLRRLLRGEAVYEAHRNHAYQRFVVLGYSHGRVTATLIAINITIAIVLLMCTHRILSFRLAAAVVLAELTVYYLVIELLRPMYAQKFPGGGKRAPVEEA